MDPIPQVLCTSKTAHDAIVIHQIISARPLCSHVAEVAGLSSITCSLRLQIKPWKLEQGDTVLLDLIPFLEAVVKNNVSDVRSVIKSYEGQDIPTAYRQELLLSFATAPVKSHMRSL